MRCRVNPPYSIIRQLPACCVPACLSMVLQRRGLLHWSQEEIGEQLGLVVPEPSAWFYRDHTGPQPPSGWGTRIGHPEYALQSFFDRNALPLQFAYDPTIKSNIITERMLLDDDQILCFESAAYPGSGHVALLTAVEDETCELIDPNYGIVKHAFSTIRNRTPENLGGTWRIRRRS